MRRVLINAPAALVLVNRSEGVVNLPIRTVDRVLKTELRIFNQLIQLVIDTGSISFHVMLSDLGMDTASFAEAINEEALTVKKYGRVQIDLLPIGGAVALLPARTSLKMELGVGISASIANGEEREISEGISLLGLGFPRKQSGSFLQQLITHGVIKHNVFTIVVDNEGNGELLLGQLKPQETREVGTLVYLPLFNGHYNLKWRVYLAKISNGHSSLTYFGNDIVINAPALLDSGAWSIGCPEESIAELILLIQTTATRMKKHQVWVGQGISIYVQCDDVKYFPDLKLHFKLEDGTTMSTTIKPRHYVYDLDPGTVDGLCKLRLKYSKRWLLGTPFFLGRAIRFNGIDQTVGLALH
ncbi:hypothetical protein FOL47_009400 [Perkinsus chesapeaki]|uniref:Peptidase A1 domain-containing protein n=1 Tax=Perkinsus chesapeaki TaxID=330153 RepID=A0A7J6L8J7_PERCH|nr:hypothetical protein FOL47_009400 [Perkinsus chesapeaki]